MALIQINRDPSPRELRQFGFVWLGFLCLFAGVAYWKTGSASVAGGLLVAAIAVPIVGWLVPAFMRLVFLALSYAAFPIGFVVSHVVLAIVYYLILTPVGLLVRATGRDPMQRRFDRDAESYWVARQSVDDPGRYFRQF